MSAFDAFKIYNSLKLHFNTENYNYFKYNGKTKSTRKPIQESQYYIFSKVDKLYGDNLVEFLVANFLENKKLWVNDLLSPECQETFNAYEKRKQSLTYLFKSDIITLFEDKENFNDIVIVGSDLPILMKEVMRKNINLETLLILNHYLKFFPLWNKRLKDHLLWDDFRLKCIKYSPFLKFDEQKFKTVLKTEINNLR